MKRKHRFAVLWALSLSCLGTMRAPAAEPKDRSLDWARYVDPFVGTDGHGHTYPGASLPFGMVQLSPDTRLSGWDGCSGYHWSDNLIYGFSHTHLSGTGVSDYGDILFMPIVGKVRLNNGAGGKAGSGYGTTFDKETERAAPGWYAVRLDSGIDVDLTVTERAGMHRYRFPQGELARVVIDLTHRDEVLDAGLVITSPTRVEGWRRSSAWARDQIVYFSARFSRPFERGAVTDGDSLGGFSHEIEGKKVKGLLFFGSEGSELLIKVGISAVDIEGARRNLDTEIPGWNFDAVQHAARQQWNQALGRIEISGGTEPQRTIFYTALYHSLLAPNVFSDVDGRYLGMDGAIHQAEGRRQYTVFSLWDTFRATHPLLTLIEPERAGEFIATFLAQFEQGGRLPVWELAGNETDCMIGYHSVSVIADAWRKGIGGFDAGKALDAMMASATRDHFGLAMYRRQGFIGAEDEPESVSKTLEYAYDDWCIAQMAEGLGRKSAADEFSRRAQSWRHLLDPATRFMRPRINQRWLAPFDPRRVDLHYTEANAWQYSFFVPHDVPGLIEGMGGEELFMVRLDSLFEAESRTTGREQADITGLIGQYAHGNEPSHHMAWLYHYAGRPDRSAPRVRRILDTLYGTGAAGLCGNEDCGQMSSWYVLSAMGLYPVCPGSNEYVIGAPLFSAVTLHLARGRRFRIRAQTVETGGDPGAALYVHTARLNGDDLHRAFIRHEEIVGGKELELRVAATPGARWGRGAEERPGRGAEVRPGRGAERDGARGTSRVDPVLPAPFARADADVFHDSLVVGLDCADATARILYTRASAVGKDAVPAAWKVYERPLSLRQSARVRFVAEKGGQRSPVVESVFHRLPNAWKVQIENPPNPQYTAGGPQALVDGLRGKSNWRLGAWHGYQDTDFTAIVDFGAVQKLHRVGAGFLQDVGSWIWMPTEVDVSVSVDGKRYESVARLRHEIADTESGVVMRDLVSDISPVRARYLRIVARNYGAIPEWHPGHGGNAFIFVDEILVE